MRLRASPGFRLFWTASTVSDFGSQVTPFAIAVLIVTTLGGTAADVGLVNAALAAVPAARLGRRRAGRPGTA
jgi:hypothetical protein